MDNRQNNAVMAEPGTGDGTVSGLYGHAPVLCSRELFRDTNTVQIEHDGQRYLLRLTRGNKLILTK